MDQKNKERLIAGGFIVCGIVAFYLLTRGDAQTPAGNSLSLGGSQYGPPDAVTTNEPGGLTYNGGSMTIPSLAQQGMPSVTVNQPGGGGGDCCCGCDAASSGVNGFATSVAGALNSYAASMGTLEQNTQASLFGNIPDYVSQYFAVADPNAPGGLNG